MTSHKIERKRLKQSKQITWSLAAGVFVTDHQRSIALGGFYSVCQSVKQDIMIRSLTMESYKNKVLDAANHRVDDKTRNAVAIVFQTSLQNINSFSPYKFISLTVFLTLLKLLYQLKVSLQNLNLLFQVGPLNYWRELYSTTIVTMNWIKFQRFPSPSQRFKIFYTQIYHPVILNILPLA